MLLERTLLTGMPNWPDSPPSVHSLEPGRRLLLLSGLGGSGQIYVTGEVRARKCKTGVATVVVLDFDRPGIDGRDTLWLEMEMARQMGAQYPEYDQILRQAREEVRKTSADQRHAQETYSADALKLLGVLASAFYIRSLKRFVTSIKDTHFCLSWIPLKKWSSEN